MSIFGNPLPYEDNTAASLIRRGGYPPEETYNQKPEVYQCPCCSEFAQAQERERLVRAAKDQKEAERRRLMQLDVFDERAKPLPSASQKRRQSYRSIGAPAEEPELAPQSDVPAPPATLDELRRARQQAAEAGQNPAAKLIVTVHHGENLSGAPRDPLSVIVRCGAFEGRTAKVPRGKDALTTWDELFEFPYPNSEEPLEVLVVNDSLPDTNEHLLGGVVVPSDALHQRDCGNEELLPVMPEDEMQTGYGTVKEGPLGTIVASWYVSEDGQDRGLDASALEHQSLDQSQICTFVAHRVFQYTDNGSEPFTGGVLCVLRDTDDNCSESVLYTTDALNEPSVSPYFGKEGYHYMPENPSQMMELHTDKKLGHILVCVPKDESAAADEEEELIVVGAVPLDFERLHNKGSAVLLVESKSKEDALWGEIQIEWLNKPAAEAEEAPRQIEQVVQEESLFVTAVRGLNLTDRKGVPVENAHVVVTTEDLEGAGTAAPAEVDADGNHVITWNQEIRFIGVKPDESSIDVSALSDGRPISTGRCAIPDEEGTVIVKMHDVFTGRQHLGDIVVDYKRLHAAEDEATRAIEAPAEAAEEAEEEKSDVADEETEEEKSDIADEEAEAEEDGEPLYPREDDDEPAAATEDRAIHADEEDAVDEEAEDEEKPPLYTDADDAAAAEEDENPLEEEEEEEAPVAESRAAPVPEEEPTKADDGADEEQEDEDPLEEEEESTHGADEQPAAAEEADDMYPTEDADHDDVQDDVDEEVEEEEPVQQAREAPAPAAEEADEDEDPLEEEEEPEQKDASDTYPTEEPEEEKEEAPQSEPKESDADEEVEQDEEDTYPTEDVADAAQDRAVPEPEDADEEDADEEAEHAEENMYPTEDEPAKEDDEVNEEEEEVDAAQDRAAPEPEEADEDADHADEGMYPTEDEPAKEDAESDADKYEQDDDEDPLEEEEEVENRDVPAVETAAGDAMYPTEDTAADAAPADDAPAAEDDAAPESEAGTDMAAPKSNSRSPRAHPSWKRKPSGDSTKYPGYQKPWYPSGNAASEQHLPYEKTKLANKSQESIKELEARRARLAEESQRRGSSPRLSDDEL